MLRILWLGGAPMSIPGCIAQSYFGCVLGATDCYLLAAMAYDRYLAICKPLHYSKIMVPRLQYFLVIFCWVMGILLTSITLIFLVKLEFCGPNIIDHYYCDLNPLIELSCSDTSVLQIEILVLSFLILVMPFLFVLVSYACVFVTILSMSSITGRKKAFSTCSSHISVVGMLYGFLIINYTIPVKRYPVVINKVISLIFTVGTPLLSPIIYIMRNQDIRNVIKTLFKSPAMQHIM
ncbi:olfactory receptor 10A3-like [Mantella aurantiaca]